MSKGKPKLVYVFIATFAILVVAALTERFILRNRNIDLSKQQKNELTQKISKEIKVKNLSNGKLETLSRFEGKVTLINFWASWCEACMVEMPSIQKLYETLHPEGFEILAINLDDNPAKVLPTIIKKFNLSFEIFLDQDGALSQEFDVVGIPFSVILDQNLNVVWIESGERDWATEEVISEIRKILKQK